MVTETLFGKGEPTIRLTEKLRFGFWFNWTNRTAQICMQYYNNVIVIVVAHVYLKGGNRCRDLYHWLIGLLHIQWIQEVVYMWYLETVATLLIQRAIACHFLLTHPSHKSQEHNTSITRISYPPHAQYKNILAWFDAFGVCHKLSASEAVAVGVMCEVRPWYIWWLCAYVGWLVWRLGPTWTSHV